MSENVEELAACPFCGNRATVIEEDDGTVSVTCTACLAQSCAERKTLRAAVIQRWNRRVTSATPPPAELPALPDARVGAWDAIAQQSAAPTPPTVTQDAVERAMRAYDDTPDGSDGLPSTPENDWYTRAMRNALTAAGYDELRAERDELRTCYESARITSNYWKERQYESALAAATERTRAEVAEGKARELQAASIVEDDDPFSEYFKCLLCGGRSKTRKTQVKHKATCVLARDAALRAQAGEGG